MPDQFRGHDDVLGRNHLHTMRKRWAREIGVQQRHRASRPAMPSQMAMYSGRFGIISATASTVTEPLFQRPTRVLIGAPRELAVRHALAIRKQRRRLGRFPARSSMTAEKIRCGFLPIGAVSSRARSHACLDA